MTETEKTLVVEFVKNLLFNNLNTEFTNAEIRERIHEYLGYSIAPATLGSIITKRVGNNLPNPYILVKNPGVYKITIKRIYNLTKEKSQVFLCDKEGYRELIWDYNILNFNYERTIEDVVNNEDSVEIGNNTYKKHAIIDKISKLPEWIFSYPNILEEIFSIRFDKLDFLPKKINKSDIELTNFFCPCNAINYTWIDALIFIHKFTDNNDSLVFKGLNKKAFLLLQDYEDEWNCLGIKEAVNLLNLTKKLAVCAAKNLEEIYDYCDIFCGLIEMEKFGWSSYLDTNRTFGQNYEIFEEYKDKAKNDIISKNLKKLNFLNNYQIEDYVIYVPQDKKDLVEEGKAQNNCVGYYYNESIIKGENLIYFIRKKENPTKSFVTCRYKLADKSTVEHRTKNNKWYGNENLINAIDKLINENI